MELYIDTANLDEIKRAHDMGVLDGVTTNPSLIAKEGVDYVQRLEEICEVVKGPVSAEVIATEFEAMLSEGRERAKIAGNIVVKLPTTSDGIRACKALSDEGIRCNMTLCFQAMQAWMAAKATTRRPADCNSRRVPRVPKQPANRRSIAERSSNSPPL